MAAHLLLTQELADALADAVRRGAPVAAACKAAGISESSYYGWLSAAKSGHYPNGDPVSVRSTEMIERFLEQISQARAECEVGHIQAISEAGSAIGKNGVPEWRARAWFLNNHPTTRSTYHQEQPGQAELPPPISREHQMVRELSPEDLRRAYEALNAGDTSDMDPKG